MKKNILVLLPVNDSHKELIEKTAPGWELVYSSNETASQDQIKNADIIFGNPPANLVGDSTRLKWLQLHSVGIGEYAKENVLPEGVILTNATGAYGLAISECMIGVLLELFKNLHLYRDKQTASDWSYAGPVKSIYGSTVLILGAGDIGGEFAWRMKALGAYTIGIRRADGSKPDYLDELYFMESIDSLLPRADIVALCLPATNQTAGMINRKRLGMMKQDAVLINVGRGSTVDTEALCDALESGRLLGAAMDVTDPEPLPKDHRLWKMKNAVITPHAFGGFSLNETHERIVNIFVRNLDAFVNGRPLTNVIDRTVGY